MTLSMLNVTLKPAPHEIYLYKRADTDSLCDHLAPIRDSFPSSEHRHLTCGSVLSPRLLHLLKGSKAVLLTWFSGLLVFGVNFCTAFTFYASR